MCRVEGVVVWCCDVLVVGEEGAVVCGKCCGVGWRVL